jgi:hypothetical protein
MLFAFAKFGFIHRRLWQRDGVYRAALLLGPAAFIGITTAIVLKKGIHGVAELGGHSSSPSWAVPRRADNWNVDENQAQKVQPSAPLPAMTANGELSGYVPGWRGTINDLEFGQTLDVALKREPISGFVHDGPTIDVARLLTERPKGPPFAGVGTGFLAVKTAGTYSLSINFARPAGQAADCLLRLGFGPRRVVSELELSLVGDISKTFDPIKFDLQPGLYNIAWAFGCWHEHEEIGPGQMTVLVGHPGEGQLAPARPGDIVRAKTAGP